MPQQSIRANLEAKKAELAVRMAEIEEALRDLDKIEALAGIEPHRQLPGNKSYSQAIYESLSQGEKSMQELRREFGLSEQRVLNAVGSHRLRRIVRRKRAGGKTIFYLDESDSPDVPRGFFPNVSQGILDLLAEQRGKPMRSREIADALQGKVLSSAKNFHGAVAATLSNLIKAGRIEKSKTGGGYCAIGQREATVFDDV